LAFDLRFDSAQRPESKIVNFKKYLQRYKCFFYLCEKTTRITQQKYPAFQEKQDIFIF